MRISRAVKYGIYSTELLVLFVFQALPGFVAPIFGATPMLVLGAAITIALLEPETPALFFGMVGGFLMDLSFGSLLGLFGMILAIICCGASIIVNKKIGHRYAVAAWIGGIALAVTVVLDWLLRYVLAGYSGGVIILVNNFVPMFFYTLLLMPILYILNLGVFLGLRPVEIQE